MTTQAAPALVPPAPRVRRRTRPATVIAGFVGLLALLSLARVISGANDITSGGTLGATISLAVPIALAGLGGLWAERSGVVNIGLEGMMILGTWFGADLAYLTGSPWMGIVGGIIGGLIGAIVHAVATVTFGVDQIISGVAITLVAGGATRYLSVQFFRGYKGGGESQSPTVPTFSQLKVPGVQSPLTKLEKHEWFFISDVAGLLRGLATTLTPFTVIALALIPLTWFILWRTAFGLRLRSCGENPSQAESQGVKVYTTKYIAVLVSGALAGMGGAFLVDYGGQYREGQTAGRGFIGLAAMIFGNWRPGGLLAGAGLFGYTDATQSRSGVTSVHALLLLVGLLLAAYAAYLFWRGSRRSAVLMFIGAGLVFLWYATTSSIPQELVNSTPYIITLFVLAVASQRLRPPAADGIPWRHGQGS